MQDDLEGKRVRLALLDDHGLFRESLGHLLSAEADIEVVGLCSTFNEGLALLANNTVDLVLLDLTIESKRCEDFITSSRQAGYTGRFLLVTAAIDVPRSVAVLRVGVSGIFLKGSSCRRLLQAIRLVSSGEAWIDQTVVELLAERYPYRNEQKLQGLSPMEQTVLNGLLEGLTSREIGSRIGTSESSVKGVVQQLFDKAGVRKRSQLVRVALEGSLGGEILTPNDGKIGHPHVIF